jgi:hypothetical protein
MLQVTDGVEAALVGVFADRVAGPRGLQLADFGPSGRAVLNLLQPAWCARHVLVGYRDRPRVAAYQLHLFGGRAGSVGFDDAN